MQITYNGNLYRIIGYSLATRKLSIRAANDPNAPIRHVLVTWRIIGLTNEMRQALGIPAARFPNWRDRMLAEEASFFSKDPIINTEP